MSKQIRSLVVSLFEEELQKVIDKIGYGKDAIHKLGGAVETAYKSGNFNAGELFSAANEILLPKIIENYDSKYVSLEDINVQELFENLSFGKSFWQIQDMVYYSHANDDLITFEKKEKNIRIRVNDPSIFRQLVAEVQVFRLNSITNKNKEISGEYIENLLKGTKEFDFENKNVIRVMELLEEIIEWKLAYYFSYIPEESNALLNNYQYSEFIKVYKVLMFYAMYTRYYSQANRLSSVITYTEDELIFAVREQYKEIADKTVKSILHDIASSSRSSFIYIKEESKYYLFATRFTLLDGINNILKHYAKTNPDDFSANISKIMGVGLVNKVKHSFEQYKNHKVFTNVQLDKFDPKLPDIDLLSISYEPSFGFKVFIAEVKNNLPATWGKDYLKAQGKYGFLTKAISQIEIITEFLNTNEGNSFLVELVLSKFKNLNLKSLFPDGIYFAKKELIITSQSIGMFFPDKEISVIDGDTLCHIINASDGDTVYIQFHIDKLTEIIDECMKVSTETISIGEYNIEYDAVGIKKFFGLAEHQYLSDGTFDRIEKDSIETGYTMARSHSSTDISY